MKTGFKNIALLGAVLLVLASCEKDEVKLILGAGVPPTLTVSGTSYVITDSNLTWGVGPTIVLPTATDRQTGAGKWSAGPAGVVVVSSGQWVYGGLASQIWSFRGLTRGKMLALLLFHLVPSVLLLPPYIGVSQPLPSVLGLIWVSAVLGFLVPVLPTKPVQIMWST